MKNLVIIIFLIGFICSCNDNLEINPNTMNPNPMNPMDTTTLNPMDTTTIEPIFDVNCSVGVSNSCDIIGDYVWINAPVHPLIWPHGNNSTNTIRFLEGGSGLLTLGDTNFSYEVTSSCKLRFRNFMDGSEISEHNIIALDDNILVFEDQEHCSNGMCVLLKKSGFENAFDKYIEQLNVDLDCNLNLQNLSCDCPSSSFGFNCANTNYYVDNAGNDNLVFSKKSNDNKLLFLVKNDVLNNNHNLQLIKTEVDGTIIFKTIIYNQLSFSNFIKYNKLIEEDELGNIYVIYPETPTNSNHNFILTKLSSSGDVIFNKVLINELNTNASLNLSMHINSNGFLIVYDALTNYLAKIDLNGNITTQKRIDDLNVVIPNIAPYNNFFAIFHSGVSGFGLKVTTFDYNLNKLVDSQSITSELNSVMNGPLSQISTLTFHNDRTYIPINTASDGLINASNYLFNLYGLEIDENLTVNNYIKGFNNKDHSPAFKFDNSGNLIQILRDASQGNPHFSVHDSNLKFEYSVDLPNNVDFKRFDCLNFFEINDKYYLIGNGFRFVNNILIKEVTQEGLYVYRDCD